MWRYLLFPGFPFLLIPILMFSAFLGRINHRRHHGHWPIWQLHGEPSWGYQTCLICDKQRGER